MGHSHDFPELDEAHSEQALARSLKGQRPSPQDITNHDRVGRALELLKP